jgi:hypothetical protein
VTETPVPRIRWELDKYAGWIGYVSTLDASMFAVWPSPCDGGHYVLGDWVLTSQIPTPGIAGPYSSPDPEALKAEAESLLEEFVTSLGAIFPAQSPEIAAVQAGEE